MENETLISVKGLYRYYGNYCAVNNVSFDLNRGEVLGFLGPNGAGKSTTMQIISGVLAASKGEVSVAGYDISAQPRLAKSHLGFLPELPPLYHDLTVDEYLVYCARLRGLSRRSALNSTEHAKKLCGLTQVGHRLLRNLSHGYQQRAGIAQAIIHSPSVIVLDEPTSGLDPIQIREIRNLIRELGRDQGVILSTHILPEVQSVCDRVLIINQGELVLDKEIDNLIDNKSKQRLKVAFRQPPTEAELLKITGVLNAEQLDSSSFLLELADDQESLDKLIEEVVKSGWGLCQLQEATDSLEETFTMLVSGKREESTQIHE